MSLPYPSLTPLAPTVPPFQFHAFLTQKWQPSSAPLHVSLGQDADNDAIAAAIAELAGTTTVGDVTIGPNAALTNEQMTALLSSVESVQGAHQPPAFNNQPQKATPQLSDLGGEVENGLKAHFTVEFKRDSSSRRLVLCATAESVGHQDRHYCTRPSLTLPSNGLHRSLIALHLLVRGGFPPASPPSKPVACCCYSATRRVKIEVSHEGLAPRMRFQRPAHYPYFDRHFSMYRNRAAYMSPNHCL